jgi:hypothetical protein
MKPVQPQQPSLRLPAHERVARRTRTALPRVPRQSAPPPLPHPTFIPAWRSVFAYGC